MSDGKTILTPYGDLDFEAVSEFCEGEGGFYPYVLGIYRRRLYASITSTADEDLAALKTEIKTVEKLLNLRVELIRLKKSA